MTIRSIGRRRTLHIHLVATALAVLPCGMAQAEDATPAPQPEGGDIVVTATRQETSLQKTPVAVSVIGAQQIAQQNVITARDLAGQVPGVTIQRSGITPTTQVFFIRGIGNSDPIFDPNVAQYVDDIYLPRAINGMTDLTDIERVEVLRGPQGTLYGMNANAGAIRYITRTPTEETRASFDVGGGNFDTLNAHAYVSGGIAKGLAGSIAVAHDQHDGYTYNPTLDRYVNNQKTTGARAKLLATLSPDLTVLLTADYTRDRSGSAYYVPKQPIIGGTLKNPIYGEFHRNRSYASQEPLNHSATGGVSAKLSYAVTPALTFNSISAYRGFEQDPVNYNNDGQPLVPYSDAYPTPVSISNNYIRYHEKEATQEFQLQGKWDRFDFTSGLYFLYEDFKSDRIGYVVSPVAATPAPAFPFDQIGRTKSTNYAAFAQGNYHLADGLIVTLGGRYTIVHRSFGFQGINTDFQGVPLPAGHPGTAGNFTYHGARTWRSFTPKAGLSYQLTPTIFSYASISRGFGAGGFNNRANSLATALPYDQEKVTTYEGGLRTDWLGHRLRLNATVFYNDYRDMQQTAAIISPVNNALVSVRANAGKAHTQGFELEGNAEPIPGLILTGSVSYLRAKYDSFPNAGISVVNGVPTPVGATGNTPPLSPRWQLAGGVNYRLPIDVPGAMRVGVNATRTSAYFSDVFNYAQGRVTPQSYVDGSISYATDGGHWTYSLVARNIGNVIHYQSITWGGTPNLWQGPVSPPRTVFFKIAYSL